MKISTIHRLQGAAFATLALLGAGYGLAAHHDAKYESVFDATYPVTTLSLAPDVKPMPIHVYAVRNGVAEVSMTIGIERMKDLIILPDAIRASPVNYNTESDPFRSAVARYGVGRYGGYIDCRTGRTDWRNLEAATSFRAPASWTQSFVDRGAKPFIPVVSQDALRIICSTSQA